MAEHSQLSLCFNLRLSRSPSDLDLPDIPHCMPAVIERLNHVATAVPDLAADFLEREPANERRA